MIFMSYMFLFVLHVVMHTYDTQSLLPPPDLHAHTRMRTHVQAAFILSITRKSLADETQETLRTSQFPVSVSR